MASNITVQYFLDLFDEFSKTKRSKLQAYLDIASSRTPVSVWGEQTNYATALLAAHIMTVSGRQGGGSSGGAITDESVGDLSRSYQYIGEVGSGDAGYMVTRYGIEYINLRNETVPTLGLARTGFIPPRRC